MNANDCLYTQYILFMKQLFKTVYSNWSGINNSYLNYLINLLDKKLNFLCVQAFISSTPIAADSSLLSTLHVHGS